MLYTWALSFTYANAGGTADFISIVPATNQHFRLVRFVISQTGEIAEAAEEDIRFSIQRLPATVTAGSGGTAFTTANAAAVERLARALSTGPTVRYNDTTPATTSGTAVVLEEHSWNVRATPLELRWDDPKSQYDVGAAEALVITTPTTPADDIVLSITVVGEVLGVI